MAFLATTQTTEKSEVNMVHGKGCDSCNGPMSHNPHPNAGTTFALLEVGAKLVCIPCDQKLSHGFKVRALKAEAKIEAMKTAFKGILD